ncbi:MAG: hypothetical protein K8S56_02005 [Candidatus Cloacimonetes bacterium]|nr:hypothetical protein [Candidatus Cloacimonadota bacterium]
MFGKKLISGIVTFTALLFSSYHGNDAQLSRLTLRHSLTDIQIESRLENAFEYDFEEIFKCGRDVDIWFRITIRHRGEVLRREHFVHKVIFDPMKQSFLVNLQEQQSETECRTMEELKLSVSSFITTIKMPDNIQLGETIEVELTAYLTEVTLPSINEKIDLMILWEYSEPTTKSRFKVGDYEI